MSRSEIRVVFVRTTAKPEVNEPVLQGHWCGASSNGETFRLDELKPSDWPPVTIFIRPGTMSRSAAARVLQALAHEVEQDGVMH